MTRKPSPQAKLKLDRIQEAIQPLVGIPEFTEFMEIVRNLKDEAVANSLDFQTVASERNSLVSKGEVLCYLNVLNIYDGQKEHFDALTAQQNEQAQQQG